MPHYLTHLRAALRMVVFVTGTLLFIPFQLIYMLVVWSPKRQSPIVRLWFRLTQWLLNIHVTIINKKLLSRRKKLFLGNHISYLDIIVLGAAFDCFFIAKSDVASWPIFGFLSKIGGTIFVSRSRARVKEQIPLLKRHIDDGKSLYLFPEGTTSNGRHVLAFKSSLLNVLPLVKKQPVLQPISLAYTHMNDREMLSTYDFDTTAWYGDMTLPPHLWNVFRQKNFKATIMVHPVIAFDDLSQVKALSAQAHDVVKDGFSKILPQ